MLLSLVAAVLDPFSEKQLIDGRNLSCNGMSLMLGAEYRKGSRRVQGVFGMGVLFGFISDKTAYRYANELTTINQQPSSASWCKYTDYGYRVLRERSETGVFVGATGSAGVEWFVAPKIALGAQVDLSLYYVAGGQVYTESEGYNTSTKVVENRRDLSSPGDDYFRFGTDSLGGALYVAFYF